MTHSDPAKGDKKIFLQEKSHPNKAQSAAQPMAHSGGSQVKLEVEGRDRAFSSGGRERALSNGGRERAASGAAPPAPVPVKQPQAELKPYGGFEEELKKAANAELQAGGGGGGKPGKEEATEADLDAYKETLRAMCLDDRLSADELRFLAEMRRQRMIKEKQHFQALVELGITKERFTQMVKNGRDENKHFVGRECVTCMDSIADFIVLRCFHLCLCERCATELKNQPPAKQKCPKCNAQFTEIQKVF